MILTDHPDLKEYEAFFPAGSVVFSEGDQARDIYILVSGRLDIVKGDKKISEISNPDFFGELSFLLGTVRIASVIAAEDSRILCFPSEKVNTVWKQFPEFGEHMAKILARRLHDTTNIAQGFREFCDLMPDAVIMTDTEHRVICWNQAAEKLYGRKWAHMHDKPIEEIYDNQAAFHQFMAELQEQGSVAMKTMKINHPEKEWFFVSTSTTLLKDAHDNIQGYLFIGRDVTSHQQLAARHQRVKSWLTPLLIILILLTGWLLWRQNISPSVQMTETDAGGADAFYAKIAEFTAPLELALVPALTLENDAAADLALKEFFDRYQPYLNGISGLLVLDRQNIVIAVYAPGHPEISEMIGSRYDGSKFTGNGAGGQLAIYLAERAKELGGQSIEALMAINDSRHNSRGWLVLQLDPGTLEKKFSLNVNEIAAH